MRSLRVRKRTLSFTTPVPSGKTQISRFTAIWASWDMRKRTIPDMMIALCGCMMQEPQVVEKIKKSYRFVDLVFGTHNLYKFAELV